MWDSGLVSYTDQNWQQAVDMMEEVVRLYDQYRSQTVLCNKQCEGESELLFYILVNSYPEFKRE